MLLVEDEIVTREGIRDNVDWQGHGFILCAEAPDGEIALQLLQNVQPDLIITDIKMPFMDGLQLCKIVKERMPWIEIVILSGHDEFEYAQKAIKLDVKDYLLKPITVQELHRVLDSLYQRFEEKRKEKDAYLQLQQQLQESYELRKEKFLQQLLIGALSVDEMIGQSKSFGLDIFGMAYLVIIVKITLADHAKTFNFEKYLSLQSKIQDFANSFKNLILVKINWEDYALILIGNNVEQAKQQHTIIVEKLKNELYSIVHQIRVGTGGIKNRLSDLPQSFSEALMDLYQISLYSYNEELDLINKHALLQLDPNAVEDFLSRCSLDEYDEFFESNIYPLGESILSSSLIKNYLIIEFSLKTAKYIHALGGDPQEALTMLNMMDAMIENSVTIEQLKAHLLRILTQGIHFRESCSYKQNKRLLLQAKKYIEEHFNDPELSLQEVAATVNLSPNYLSSLFSQEIQKTFRDYLSELRINRAKEYLLHSDMKTQEIAELVGYSDAHYFSTMFKKLTGMTPTTFRDSVKDKPHEDIKQ